MLTASVTVSINQRGLYVPIRTHVKIKKEFHYLRNIIRLYVASHSLCIIGVELVLILNVTNEKMEDLCYLGDIGP